MLNNKKSIIETYLDPFVGLFKHTSPNVLTLLGSIPSILFFVFVIYKWYVFAIFVFIGMSFDMIDGMVARKYNKATKFGGFLDSVFDRISDFLIITAFAFGGIVRWEIAAPFLLFSFMISYARSRSETLAKDKNISFAVGLMERTERLVLTILALILYILFPNVLFWELNIAEIIFVVLITLSFYTIYQRILHAYKNLQK